MQKSNLLFHLFFLLTVVSYAQSVPSEAHRLREAKYDVKFYFLNLDIEANSPAISGDVMMRSESLVNGLDTIAVELDPILTIDSVKASLNSGVFQPVTVFRKNTEVNIELPFTADVNEIVETQIFYHGTPTPSTYLNSGFWSSNNPSPHKFSASPPYNSYTWWPCKQVLTDKADSSRFFITTVDSSIALSNGVLHNTVTLPGNKKRWEWGSQYPIDFYNISFVVGSFTETIQYWYPEGRTDSMALKFYNYTPSSPNLVQNILDVFSNRYGLYPFYKEQLAISRVELAGGIENQTSISLGADGVEAHEIAHQWWGCNTTCGSWKDVALNEGFAEYSIAIYDEFSTGISDPSKRISRISSFETNAVSKPDGCIYGPGDTTSVYGLGNGVFANQAMFYRKAACVYNSLRFEINNDSMFFQGLKNFQMQLSGKTATGDDLKNIMQDVSGKDLTDFFNQWYYGYGYPTFSAKWKQTSNHLFIQLTETASSSKTPLFKTPLEIKVQYPGGDTTIRLSVLQLVSDFDILINKPVAGIIIDPNQWVINKPGAIENDPDLSVQQILPEGNYSVYPNPAAEYLLIKSDLKNNQTVKVEMFNLIGERILNGYTNSAGKMMLPDIADGVYFLRLNRKNYFNIVIKK